MNNVRFLKFNEFSDSRGTLVPLELNKEIPFHVKRVYYTYNLNDEPRGFHSHIVTEQVFICLKGSMRIKFYDGTTTEILELNDPTEGIYCGINIWHEMYDFEEGTVLLVLASENYSEEDYVRDISLFEKSVRND